MKNMMKTMAAIMVVAFACSSAFAASKNVEFKTFKPVKIGSTELKPGEYVASVETSGAEAKVTILQNRKSVATAAGKFTEAKVGFGFAVVTEGDVVKQLQGDKVNGTIELQ